MAFLEEITRWALVGGALLLLALPAGAQEEPRFEGKTLAEWTALMERNPGSHGAVRALGEIGEPAIPALIRAMRGHPDGAIRWLTHLALAKVGRAALPELDRVTRDGDSGARIQAVLAFEKMLGTEAIPRLREATRDADGGVRVRAHGALLRLGEPAAEHLPPMIESLAPSRAERWLAAEALGMSKEKAAGAVEALAAAAAGSDAGVADRALRALEEIATPEAMAKAYPILARGLEAKQPLGLRLKTVVRLGQAGPTAHEALPALRALVARRDEDIMVRGYAAWAVDAIDPRPAGEKGVTYHVAQRHPRADDASPGTAVLPWRSVQRAAETLRPGDTVLIHDGLYRECVRPFVGGTGPDRRITYAAAPGETPVLTAADPWKPEWRREAPGIWSAPYERHPWDHPEKWPNPQRGPAHRAEQVVVDGKLLEHVATRAEMERRAGTFFTDDEGGRLILHLEDERSPEAHAVERAVRQQVFAPAVRGLGYLRVRGLTLRYGAAPESNGANWREIGHRSVMSVRAGHHWEIEGNVIEWGNAQGLDIGGEGWSSDLNEQPGVTNERGWHVARRNRVNHHGVAGIVGWGAGQEHLLLDENETSYNCRKGNFYAYEAAGVKLHGAKDCVVRRHRSHRNEAFGIWFDYNCERNRVTQCLLTENRGAGFFFEVSAGPFLVDNNVVLNTRDATGGNWGEGIYSHDGNHALYTHNLIAGCAGYGVRLRNLFSRVADGKPTTTSHNRVWNNLLFDNKRGAVSLNPEVPRAEENRSDGNVLWQAGTPVTCRLEDAGSGVRWEKTAVGKALERTGGGDLPLALDAWQEHVGHDRGSVVVPRALLSLPEDPEKLRSLLLKLWPKDAPPLDGGYAEAALVPAGDLLAKVRRDLSGCRAVRTLALGPTAGVQVWDGPRGAFAVRWEGSAEARRVPLRDRRLLEDPLDAPAGVTEVAAGDTLGLPLPEGARVLFAGMEVSTRGRRVALAVPADATPGEYSVVLAVGDRWQRLPVRVQPAFDLPGLEATRADGSAVLLSLANHRAADAVGQVVLELAGERVERQVALPPGKATQVRLPVALDGAGEAVVTAKLPGVTLERRQLVSFARVGRSGSWEGVPRTPIDGFPGGAFPEGAEAFALFQGSFKAQWAARQDDQALHVRVEVQDARHLQEKGVEELWKQDSVQLLVMASSPPTPLELDVALPSKGGDPVLYRRQSPVPERFPVGAARDVAARVTREGVATTYEVALPWAMLGLDGPLAPGSAYRLSILVNNDDGAGRLGLQWFFGIHTHRGDNSRMGTVWVE